MRAVIQRIREASVVVEGHTVAETAHGLLVYLGVAPDDGLTDVQYLTDKIRHLRIFSDEDQRLNLDVGQVNGEVLVVSAFTVQADARKGRRPSFEAAAQPDHALGLYELLVGELTELGLQVKRGAFGSMMEVRSVNDGPICVLLDSRRNF